MAKSLHFNVSVKWWVQPYLYALMVFIHSVRWFADPYEMECFIDDQCEWVGHNGFDLRVSHGS